MTSLDLPYIHDSSSLACRNSYCVHLNVSNSLLSLTVFGRESCLKICYPLEQSTRCEISLQFLVYIIRFERILKTRSRSSIRIPKKQFYRLEKHSKLPFFFPPPFQTIMDRSLGTLSRSWGVFQCTQVQPLPSPHKQLMLDECIQNFFRVSTLYRVWGGRTARKFRKGCTV